MAALELLDSRVGLINFPRGEESEFVNGVSVEKCSPFVEAIAALTAWWLKTEDAALDELAEPTP